MPDGTKKCTGPCGRELPATSAYFHKDVIMKDGLQNMCKDCKKQYMKTYRKEHHATLIDNMRMWHKEHRDEEFLTRLGIKQAVIDHYGGKCSCPGCGETNLLLLNIDHIDGGGNEHRKSIGAGQPIYRWLIKNNFPSGFQVLCFNCNFGKWANGGVCPHHDSRLNVPTIITGGRAVDDRGALSFVNDFDILRCRVRRFYQVENHRAGFIRAWHGHEVECKYVFVNRGAAMIKIVDMKEAGDYIDEGLVGKSPIRSYVLSSDCPKILCIPSGYFNGFKTLREDTIVQFLSTSTTNESKNDDLRLPWDAMGKEVWNEDFR